MEVKIDKNGKVTIPKYLRDEYNLKHGVKLDVSYHDFKLVLKPVAVCHKCGKALPEELFTRGACIDCPPPIVTKIY